MPGVRLPQSREEVDRATDEILIAAERAKTGDDYADRPGAKKPRPNPYAYTIAPACHVHTWLEDLSVLGAIQEHELTLRADRAILDWPEDMRAIAGRDIVRILVRRKWARSAS